MRADLFLDQRSPMNSELDSCRFENAESFHTGQRSRSYSFEYGEAEVEMHTDALTAGERVVLIDDLLATGGTSSAAAILIRKAGGQLLEAQFLDRAGIPRRPKTTRADASHVVSEILNCLQHLLFSATKSDSPVRQVTR